VKDNTVPKPRTLTFDVKAIDGNVKLTAYMEHNKFMLRSNSELGVWTLLPEKV
jgi:hypothetical protein